MFIGVIYKEHKKIYDTHRKMFYREMMGRDFTVYCTAM